MPKVLDLLRDHRIDRPHRFCVSGVIDRCPVSDLWLWCQSIDARIRSLVLVPIDRCPDLFDDSSICQASIDAHICLMILVSAKHQSIPHIGQLCGSCIPISFDLIAPESALANLLLVEREVRNVYYGYA
jgi:hypothetical protein